jgi:hypothetical protein
METLTMTHWVIIKHDRKIYAGADTLASTPEHPSELSGSGVMPGVRSHEAVNKVVQYGDEVGREVVICCADKTFPQNKATGKSKRIDFILEQDIFPYIKLERYSNAAELMVKISEILEQNYIIDEKNSLLLGCGYSENGGSIAYYNSRNSLINKQTIVLVEEYLSCRLDTTKPIIYSGCGSAGGYNSDAEFAIQEEIEAIHRSHPDTIGRTVTFREISCYDRGNPYTPPVSQPRTRSKERTNDDINVSNQSNHPQNQNNPCCIIS